MRKIIWMAIIILLFAACGNNGESSPTTTDDGTDTTIVQQPDSPRIENTPVPTSTPIPTAMPLPEREHPGHIYPVATSSIHIVAPGETLTIIASKYKVSVKAIADANRHYDFDLIEVGDALYIPACE